MKLRNYILTGLVLCVVTLAISTVLYPQFANALLKAPWILALMTLVVVWNAYAAVCRTNAKTSEDSMVLHTGVNWGIAIGCAWGIVAIVPVNVFAPHNELGAPLWFLGLFSALLLPFASGAAGAIKTGRVRIGMRIGFWSGIVGGLIGFLVVIAAGLIKPLVLSLRFAAGPSSVDRELVDWTLELAIFSMFVFGTIYGVVAGTAGGWIGLKFYLTGEAPIASTPSLPGNISV
jgi:hypothetical protein